MTVEITRKKSKKLLKIIETGEILFMRHGIKRVTVEEICRKSMVSKMTFYKHFSNKIELVKYILNAWHEEFWSNADEIFTKDIPFTEKVELMFDWKLKLMARMSNEFIDEFIHTDPELKGFMLEYYQRSYKRFRDLIVDWQKNGDIRTEIRPEFIIAFFDKMQEMFGDDNVRKLYSDSIEFILELHNLLFYGIVPRPDSEN